MITLNKAELDAWQETIDILMNPGEVQMIREAKKESTTISHAQLLEDLDFDRHSREGGNP